MTSFLRTLSIVLSLLSINTTLYAAEKAAKIDKTTNTVNTAVANATNASNTSKESITLSDKIASSYSELSEYILNMMPETQKLAKSSKLPMQQYFSQLLQERFSTAELQKITSIHQKVGAENLVKMVDVFMQSMKKIFQGTDLKDVELKISASYDALLEKKFSEEKLEDKLKSFYIQSHAKNNTEGKNLSKDAQRFVKLGKNNIKKAISDNFSEEQYRISYDFDNSELGKRLSDAFEESITTVLSKQGAQ